VLYLNASSWLDSFRHVRQKKYEDNLGFGKLLNSLYDATSRLHVRVVVKHFQNQNLIFGLLTEIMPAVFGAVMRILTFPDAPASEMVNRHKPRQCHATAIANGQRVVSHHAGVGARHYKRAQPGQSFPHVHTRPRLLDLMMRNLRFSSDSALSLMSWNACL
jgi:hypothetical protein